MSNVSARWARAVLLAAVLASMLGATLGACSASPARASLAPASEASSTARVLALVNGMRAAGCRAPGRTAPPLHRQSRLDAAAERLASGASLAQATAAAGYRAMSSVSLEISGDLSDAGLRRMLVSRFCARLSDPALRDIGTYSRGSQLWLLAAAPFAAPELSDPGRVAERVNELVNRARAAARRCGTRLYRPAPPLHASRLLAEAALAHARDMAAHSALEHTGHDGSAPGERVTRTGYLWRTVGENIAAGPTSAPEVVNGWLASPEHCANIMDPDFDDTAVAYVIDPASRMGVYWTEDFAAPLRRPSGRGTSPRSRHFGP